MHFFFTNNYLPTFAPSSYKFFLYWYMKKIKINQNWSLCFFFCFFNLNLNSCFYFEILHWIIKCFEHFFFLVLYASKLYDGLLSNSSWVKEIGFILLWCFLLFFFSFLLISISLTRIKEKIEFVWYPNFSAVVPHIMLPCKFWNFVYISLSSQICFFSSFYYSINFILTIELVLLLHYFSQFILQPASGVKSVRKEKAFCFLFYFWSRMG